MGDTILQAGGIVELADRYGGIRVPVWNNDLKFGEATRQIFSSVRKVSIFDCDGRDQLLEVDPPLILTGVHKSTVPLPRDLKPIDRIFYDEIGVPIEKQWESFPWKPSGREIEPPNRPYVFVHDAADRGYVIDQRRLNGWRQEDMCCPGRNLNGLPSEHTIIDYALLLMFAVEIHLINSSFLHLARVLNLRSEQPKYFHRYARPWNIWDIPTFRPEQNWVILD